MTERLYYDNAYLRGFDARVTRCEQAGDYWRVWLDRSAFYPTSGGQPFDTGTLGGARVTDVEVEAGDVVHTVDAPLDPGACVHGEIDWARRFDHMQQHAADHMIASALNRHLRGWTIGLHIGTEISTIDVDMPDGRTALTKEEIELLEDDVNQRVQRDVPIRCWFPAPDELEGLPLRKPPTVKEHVRIVAIGEDEMVACGGTHPSSAGQLGLVKIISAAPARGKLRVGFLAGARAYRDYRAAYDTAHQAAQLFSTGLDGLVEGIEGLRAQVHELTGELTALRKAGWDAQARALLAHGSPVCAEVPGDAKDIREIA
ncbi:MAG: alanyl-tRNA editing protein, partial [Clostridiales bacterium]|nr:alanyl-tRNA editing protein [Clostridiales bacterium]